MTSDTTSTAKRVVLLGGAVAVVTVAVIALTWGGDPEPEPGSDGQEQDAAVDDLTSEGSEDDSGDTSGDADDPRAEPSPSDDAPEDENGTPPDREDGDLSEVPVEDMVVNDPIDLDGTGDFGTGLRVGLLGIEAVDGEATGQFEVAGPALQIELEVTNDTDDEVSLTQTQVDVSYGEDRTPGMLLSGPGVEEFPSSVAAGESATATVVFGVPLDQREQVQILVTVGTDAPVIVFEGAAT